jgi:hypothetical protein
MSVAAERPSDVAPRAVVHMALTMINRIMTSSDGRLLSLSSCCGIQFVNPNTIANPTTMNKVNKKPMAAMTVSVLNVISACSTFIVLMIATTPPPSRVTAMKSNRRSSETWLNSGQIQSLVRDFMVFFVESRDVSSRGFAPG